ncbi:Lar family restriction alleviation protein [Thermophilibacter provencensis]|uniref:Lar family restriction alleviation protein n=1 Tax=Thermophilibacter provencensis TaxID=1852386 RepID=A0ABT7V3H6_9ACTN|nr:Lar family restriction alleviation protein [Thermophilibacter provencensis]MDM8270561.1 Lar family restriction alleviation protein [Thermophilibacter provencensis]
MADELRPCPFCGGEAEFETYGGTACAVTCRKCRCGTPTVRLDDGERAVEAWNRRAERTWHDFSDELPPAGVSVLCRGKNGALYVGKPVTFKGNGTRKVWVPRGDQYRTPENWMEVST